MGDGIAPRQTMGMVRLPREDFLSFVTAIRYLELGDLCIVSRNFIQYDAGNDGEKLRPFSEHESSWKESS